MSDDSYDYDIFLSFRGVDTRNTFTDHLYEALVREEFRIFRDNDAMEKGQRLQPEIETAIKGSKASIVVLSENYATSTWCLDELSLILQQKEEFNHLVFPVFYKVDPSDVRKQHNTFCIQVQDSGRWSEHNVIRWKAALTEVGSLIGFELSGSEAQFVKEIVDSMYNKLDCKQVYLPSNLIGMDTREKEINLWLLQSNLNFLVIYGMGGSGKTTLAKHIYNLNIKYFEYVSFVESIGTRCEQPLGLLDPGKQLLKDILGGKMRKIPSISHGTCKIEEALERRKAFIVLDDIVERSQLEDLLGNRKINAQSKIIITTREKDADNWLDSKYRRCEKIEMQLLTKNEALKVLSYHAFGSETPMQGFEELAEQAVDYCDGNPLALKVFGSSLSSSNTIEYWRSQLGSLEAKIDTHIESVLIRSIKSLPNILNKELFLHIACFFIGKDVDYVVKILEPDYFALSGIKTLTNKCLLFVSSKNKLMMPRMLQEMGRNLVFRESKYPSERSRVWLSNESYDILNEGEGSKTMEVLALDMGKKDAFESSDLMTDSLKKMNLLRFLQLSFVELIGSYENFSKHLRWLCWLGFHLKAIPSDLYMRNLVAIDMSYSKLEVFEPPRALEVLKILNLKESLNLLEIRNIYKIPNIETLILWNCCKLVRICESIGGLKRLAELNMTSCESLRVAVKINTLVEVKASSSGGGSQLHPSFNLPRSLQQLFLNGCKLECSDEFLHQLFLQYMNIGNNLFEFLPLYDHLKNLRVLDLTYCLRLKQLICLPNTLAELYVYCCKSLEKITFQSPRFTLHEFGYEGCTSLSEIEGLIKLVPLAKLDGPDLGHMAWLKEYQNLEMRLVGDDELMVGRNRHIQMVYEFDIMSTSLPEIENSNLTAGHISKSPSFHFDVPLSPGNRRLKGLSVTFKYTISGDDWVWFPKIKTTNGVDLIYNPRVFGRPGFGEVGIWLSYWPIGTKLYVGDQINVSIFVMSGLEVLECGATLVYIDDEVVDKTLKNNNEWIETLLGDLSAFRLSTGAFTRTVIRQRLQSCEPWLLFS